MNSSTEHTISPFNFFFLSIFIAQLFLKNLAFQLCQAFNLFTRTPCSQLRKAGLSLLQARLTHDDEALQVP